MGPGGLGSGGLRGLGGSYRGLGFGVLVLGGIWGSESLKV